MKKIIISLAAFAMALILPSCLEMETEVTLNKDGSGTITEEFAMAADALAMSQLNGQGQDPFADHKDEAKLKIKAATYGEGVTFSKVEEITKKSGSKGVRVTYNFTDINKVSLSLSDQMSNLGQGKQGGGGFSKEAKDAAAKAKATFAYADEKLTITVPQPEGAKGDGVGSSTENEGKKIDPNDPQVAMMSQMMAGLRMTVKVTLAAGIAETDATHHADGTITLFDFNLDEIMKNPEAMGSLSSMDLKKADKFGEAIMKLKGVKMEAKKEITATAK